jgi:hypothetical protein
MDIAMTVYKNISIFLTGVKLLSNSINVIFLKAIGVANECLVW